MASISTEAQQNTGHQTESTVDTFRGPQLQPAQKFLEKDSASADTNVCAPDMFTCPILKSPMYEPVVLNQTGQIYDKASINCWFERGNNTCPLTGSSLVDKSISPLPHLQNCIKIWAEANNVVIQPPEISGELENSLNALNNIAQSISLVASRGISIYDLEGLTKLVTKQCIPDTYAAMVVLRDLVSHSDEQKLKHIKKVLNMDLLKGLLWNDNLQVPAARLLVSLKGTLVMDELIPLLSISDIDLQVDVLSQLVEHLCHERSSCWVIPGSLRRFASAVSQRIKSLIRRG